MKRFQIASESFTAFLFSVLSLFSFFFRTDDQDRISQKLEHC